MLVAFLSYWQCLLPYRSFAISQNTKIPLRITGKHNQTGDRIEQNHPWSKNGSRNNKENLEGDNFGNRNPRKEIKNHRY